MLPLTISELSVTYVISLVFPILCLSFSLFEKVKRDCFCFLVFFLKALKFTLKKPAGSSQLALVSLFVSLAIYLDNLC